MNEYITLADQSVVQNSYVVKLDDSNIAIYVYDNYSFADIYAIFADENKTRTMATYQYGDEHTWEGFTEVRAITTGDDNFCVILRKE